MKRLCRHSVLCVAIVTERSVLLQAMDTVPVRGGQGVLPKNDTQDVRGSFWNRYAAVTRDARISLASGNAKKFFAASWRAVRLASARRYRILPGLFSVLRNSSPLGAGRATTTVFGAGDSMAGRAAPGKALNTNAVRVSPARTLENVAEL